MLSSDRICWPARFGKAQYLSQLPVLCIAFVTPRILSPVFTVSARNAWDHALARTHAKKKERNKDRNKEKKRNAYILRVSQLKQATLTSQFRPSPAGKLILKIKLFSYFILLTSPQRSTRQFILKSKECRLHLSLEAGVYTVAVIEKGFW